MTSNRPTNADGGWSVSALVLIALLAFPMLYLLGSGPLAWLIAHDYVSNDVGSFVYYPVIELARRFDWFARIWIAYIQLWVS